ncbi:ArsR/SmtB family transcription factor [Streptomyces albicerus]|uniref:ArsR/SmtB family transcription factor n=1 Tax=Streptomyces albicerus TaxID=2569859 RepID=UPI00124B1C1C|nr:winged helix-turn-helix domain-containing protein [Streptomyces albicerus]
MAESRVRLGRVDRLSVEVVYRPGTTLVSLLVDALGGRPQGVLPHVRRTIRAGLPRDVARLLPPLFVPGVSPIPDWLSTDAAGSDQEIHEALERMRDLSADTVLEGIDFTFGGRVPGRWEPALRDPRRYAVAFADALDALRTTCAPVLRRTRALYEREAERVGIASVTGHIGVVLSQLNALWRLDGDDLVYSGGRIGDHALGDRRFLLVPILSGSNASIFSLDTRDCVSIGYPARGLALAWHGQKPAAESRDALGHVAGQVRAKILRYLAHRPTVGETAAHLNCAPATVTYHCRQLEDAGLLARERRGQSVRMSLTPRGQALVDLLA